MDMNALTKNAVRRVGTVDPVADFRSMIANRSEDLVTLGELFHLHIFVKGSVIAFEKGLLRTLKATKLS